MKSDFLPIFIHGDNDKENPKSLLKMLEKTLVHDKHVVSKAMFESIFSSVASNEAFVRSLLQTINKIVFEAPAQSGNKETVAELEGARRTSVGASQAVLRYTTFIFHHCEHFLMSIIPSSCTL